MSKKHGWSREKAESARMNFRLNKTRDILSDNSRKSRKQYFHKKICPIPHCHKEVRRIGNHLRQTHKILSNKKFQKCIQAVDIALSDKSDSSESSLYSSSEESDEETQIDMMFQGEQHRPSLIEDLTDESDDDWLVSTYFDTKYGDNTKASENDNISEYCSGDEKDVDFCDTQNKFIVTSNTEDHVLKEFQNWLCGPDGGFKPQRSAKDKANTLALIIRSVTEYGPIDFKNLLEKSYLERWMLQGEEEKGPGTLKTYLQAVLSFYDYLEVTNCPDDVDVLSKISKMRIVIRRWQSNLYKKIEVRASQKQLEDLFKLPQPDELESFDNSKEVKNAKQLLKDCVATDINITRSQFCSMRNFLMTTLIFDNGSRAGAIANMTLEEFRKSQQSPEKGFLIAVKKHKLSYKSPVFLAMSSQVFTELDIYVKHVRGLLPGIGTDDSDNVFVSWSGRPMASSIVQASELISALLNGEMPMGIFRSLHICRVTFKMVFSPNVLR